VSISTNTSQGYQSFTSGGNASIGFERMMQSQGHQYGSSNLNVDNNANNGIKSGISNHSIGGITTSSSGETIRPSSSTSSPVSHSRTGSANLMPGRGGSLKLKDSWRKLGADEHVLENGGEGDLDGEGIGVAGAGGLARHTSLPGRGKFSYDHHVETDLDEAKEAMAFSLAEPESPLT
jgi:hypothetical protein